MAAGLRKLLLDGAVVKKTAGDKIPIQGKKGVQRNRTDVIHRQPHGMDKGLLIRLRQRFPTNAKFLHQISFTFQMSPPRFVERRLPKSLAVRLGSRRKHPGAPTRAGFQQSDLIETAFDGKGDFFMKVDAKKSLRPFLLENGYLDGATH